MEAGEPVLQSQFSENQGSNSEFQGACLRYWRQRGEKQNPAPEIRCGVSKGKTINYYEDRLEALDLREKPAKPAKPKPSSATVAPPSGTPV